MEEKRGYINMGYFRKKLERRTFSQDRYYILIKRQKSGEATFNELTELDEIVNRVPDIREKVIIESFFTEDINDSSELPNPPGNNENIQSLPITRPGLWTRVKSFLNRVFRCKFMSNRMSFICFTKPQSLTNLLDTFNRFWRTINCVCMMKKLKTNS